MACCVCKDLCDSCERACAHIHVQQLLAACTSSTIRPVVTAQQPAAHTAQHTDVAFTCLRATAAIVLDETIMTRIHVTDFTPRPGISLNVTRAEFAMTHATFFDILQSVIMKKKRSGACWSFGKEKNKHANVEQVCLPGYNLSSPLAC